MKSFFYRILARITGKNSANMPVDNISNQLKEMRPLPLGRSEFEDWSDRIISGAMLPIKADDQKYALANMIMQLGPTEHMKYDLHFISMLRKAAVNQVADEIRKEMYAKKQAALEEENKAKIAASEEAIKQLDETVKNTKERLSTLDYEKRLEGVKITSSPTT
jgi:hypothetical protein